MIININSNIIQKLKNLANTRTIIKRKEKLLNISSVYSTIVFNLANQSNGITQKEIANLNQLSRMTVYRLIKILVGLGYIKEIKGKVIKKDNKFYRTKNTYKATTSEINVFKQCKDFKGSFSSLAQFFLQFGTPKRKKGKGLKLWFNCPECGNKHCVDINRDKAFCYKCSQGFKLNGVNWFDFWKNKLDNLKIRTENIFIRGIKKKLVFI